MVKKVTLASLAKIPAGCCCCAFVCLSREIGLSIYRHYCQSLSVRQQPCLVPAVSNAH